MKTEKKLKIAKLMTEHYLSKGYTKKSNSDKIYAPSGDLRVCFNANVIRFESRVKHEYGSVPYSWVLVRSQKYDDFSRILGS